MSNPVAIYGYDGSEWQKLPLLWGFSEIWYEDLGGTQEGDGTYAVYSTPVEAGYIHVCQIISLRNNTGARGEILFGVYNDSAVVYVHGNLSPAQYGPEVFSGCLVLEYPERIRVVHVNCLDGDVLEGGVRGYKMKIAE